MKTTYTAQILLDYYTTLFGRVGSSKTNIETVEEFINKFGDMYPDDIDKATDMLHDYVLLKKGMF